MYDIGDTVTLQATFTDLDGAPADPTTVTCDVEKPDHTVTALTPTSTVTGIWTATVTIDQSGAWSYRFAGTGAVAAAEEASFRVRVRRVPAPTP